MPVASLIPCLLSASFMFSPAAAPARHAGHARPAQSRPDHSSWTLAGRVVDASGAPVPGVTVVAVNLVTGLERLATTDAEGNFVVLHLAGREYRVTASLSGFDAARRDVTAADGPVTLTLTPAAVIAQVTVVSGSRVEERRMSLNTRVDVLSRARLADTTRATVGEVLREVPGVVARRGSEGTTAAGQQILGLDSRQVAVLIDGQPIVGARGIKSGVVNLDRQPVEPLDRIEVVKGAASALFGSDAIGGAINLITREPETRLELTGSANAGAFGGRDLALSGGGTRDRISFYAAAGRHERDSFDLTPGTPDTTGSALDRRTAYGKAVVRALPTLQIRAAGTGYWNTQTGRFVGETGLQDSEVRDRATGGHVSADWQPDSRTTVQARAYGSSYREDSIGRPVDAAGVDETGLLRESLFKADVTAGRLLGERQYLQAGVEWWRDHYDGINRLRDESGHHATTSVAWIQDRISLVERATLTVGARYDRHSIFGSELSPKIGANVRVADGVHLRASFGEGFRAPDLGQLYYRFVPSANIYQVLGNPSLSPETSRSWQYGADYFAASGRLRVGVNGFRNEADDLIVADSLGFLTSPAQLQALIAAGSLDPSFSPVFGRLLLVYRNLSDVVTQGVELDGEVALGRGLSAAAAYTCLDAKDRSTGAELTGRHRHQGFARLTWAPSGTPLRAEVRGAFYGSWLATATERAGAFALWDVLAAWRIGSGIELVAAVDNLFDSQDPNTGTAEAIYRPEIGRVWRTGLRWTWRER